MPMKKLGGLSLAAAFVVLGAATATAQTTTTATTKDSKTVATDTKSTTADATVPSGDAKFMKKTAEANLKEVEMGRMGADKAASAEVKQYAQKMVDDHTNATTELKGLATTKNVELPATAEHKMSAFDDKAGVDFDKAFMKKMVADHKKVVRDFEKEAKSGKDPDVKAWAEKMLPKLREHLQEAETIYDGLKDTDATGARSTTKTSS
jgi:putative membrane protein